MSNKSKLVFLVGPTASGKSKFALELATKYKSDIVNCDSVQVYKSIDIGSAKPSKKELETVPHHLYSFVDLKDSYSVSDYYKAAQEKIISLESKSKNPIFFVGGSGFYFQALEYGMFEIPPIKEDVKISVKKEMDAIGVRGLHNKLLKIDEVTANNISENDTYRVIRAMEVYLSTGKTMSQHRQEFEKNSELKEKRAIVKIGLKVDREKLREIVAQRTQNMIEGGFIQEVKGLLEKGFEGSSALNSVGYKEVVSFVSGGISEEEMYFEINKNTMRLAKRQMTWFRRDKEIHWIDTAEEFNKDLKLAEELIAQKLS